MTDDTKGSAPADVTGTQILRFFANPWIGIAGSLASVVSVALAVYFYVQSIRYPELVYYVSPARAVVVKQGTASRLAVSFEGHPVAQDVTAAQVAIWNRGKEPIRRAAALQPLVIRTDGKVPILEATIRKKSREVVQLELNRAKMATGELGLSWNVLESGDGGVVQLVYVGGPDVRVQCTGVFEGQPGVRELRYPRTIESPSEQMRSGRRLRYLVAVIGVLGLATLVVGLVQIRRHREQGLMDLVVTILMPLVLLGLSIYTYATLTVPSPPFGLD